MHKGLKINSSLSQRYKATTNFITIFRNLCNMWQNDDPEQGQWNKAFVLDETGKRKMSSEKPRESQLSRCSEITKEPKDKYTWNNSIEFLMSCIAMSIGFGNIWRFPFIAYENGGGAFLIPYIVVLFVVGKPFYYLEMILGQFSSSSSIRVWKLSPAFVGNFISFNALSTESLLIDISM